MSVFIYLCRAENERKTQRTERRMKKRDQMCPVFEPTKAPSVSSLRSVALSDNAAGPRTGRVASSSSLAESFEEISIPPPLPQRPAPSLPYVPRRVPPLRSATTGSSNLIPTPTLDPLVIRSKRPTPVPSAARKRYISVFNANILQRRRAEAQNPSPRKLSYVQAKTKRTRQAAGWRGLSVDLITATPEELVAHGQNIQGKEWDIELVVNESIGPDETLQGQIVKAIWLRSRIEKSKLAEIWWASKSICAEPGAKGVVGMSAIHKGKAHSMQIHSHVGCGVSTNTSAVLRLLFVAQPPHRSVLLGLSESVLHIPKDLQLLVHVRSRRR